MRFMFEWMHNTKEQIYFYEREENNKVKERKFESTNERIFQVTSRYRGGSRIFLEGDSYV